jgi:hypothetical protein
MKARQQRYFHPQVDPQSAQRMCDHPGCTDEGAYRAPKSRTDLKSYYWFCLDHVRAYNASWDFYAGMTPNEIERAVRDDVTWQRETWPLGKRMSGRPIDPGTIRDPFGVFEDWAEENARTQRHSRPATPEEEAMRVMGLVGPITRDSLKIRYKQLVKLHHPDANGGAKDAEERLKQINQAYKVLKDSLNA